MNKFIDFIIAFSLKRKYLILVVTLAVIVLGVVAFPPDTHRCLP